MKKIFWTIAVILLFTAVKSNAIDLEECQRLSRDNYPMIKQFSLIEQTRDFNLSNASKSWLPQLNLNVKATYQSDVTQIPSSLGEILSKLTGKPVSFPTLTQDQYQANLELSQTLWDGGAVTSQKSSIKLSAEAEKQKLEVDLYALKERINNLYFGVLLLNEQLKQVEILHNELGLNYKKIKSLKDNGLATQSDMDAVRIEQINTEQRSTDLMTTRKNYLQILSAFTGKDLNEKVDFNTPLMPESDLLGELKRPELKWFDAQKNLLEVQKQGINAMNKPKLGLFVQGGYGRPGLNMFTNAFSGYYIGGVRLSWNLSGFYSLKNNLDKIQLAQQMLSSQEETFVFNNRLQQMQQKNETQKLKSQLEKDDEIILLRDRIKEAATAKLDNGTLTVTDLLREINASENARQIKILHQIQMLMSVYQNKFVINQ